jgi:hypothetical protein
VPARISEYQCLGHFAKKCPLIDIHRFTLSFILFHPVDIICLCGKNSGAAVDRKKACFGLVAL